MNEPPRTYLLESPSEAERLVDKVDAFAWVRRYLLGLRWDGPILEVGTGPMHLLTAAAMATGHIGVGLDRSIDRVQAGRHAGGGGHQVPQQATTGPSLTAPERNPLMFGVCGDALRLPFSTDVFGMSFARFTLQYLNRPDVAVNELARVTAPGGLVVLQDLDGQLINHFPPDPALQQGLTQFLRRNTDRFDPEVGRKLFGYARSAGLDDITVRLESYHLIPGVADSETLQQWTSKLNNALPAAASALGAKKAESLTQRFLNYLTDPDTLTFSTVFTVIGRVPDRKSSFPLGGS